MLITKFNRMIRNRVIWAAFAVLVSIAFIGVFSRGGGCSENERKSGVEGRLYDNDVSTKEFLMARFFAMGMRDSSSLSPELNQVVRRRTWKRLAALKTAEKMGLSTSDKEISEAIRRDPSFAVNGVFNKDRYTAVVHSQMGVTVQTFEQFLREEIIIQKLVSMLESAVWTSPSELKHKLSKLTDSFVVKYATFKADDHVGDVQVTTEDAERFFNENKELFAVPERINVRYVTFSISNYLSETDLDEENILKYYTNHIEEYSTTDTNNEVLPVPIEEVREDIVAVLRRNAAMFDAKDEATRFVVALAPDRYGDAPTMNKVAAEYGLTVYTSDFFSAVGDVSNLNVDRDFNNAAFDLDPSDPERYFSDAVVGQDAVYVIAADDRLEAYMPDFSEVTDQVMPLAKRYSEHAAFLEKSREIRNSVESALRSGKTLEEAIKDFNMNVSTTATFTAYDAWSDDLEYFDILVPNVISMRKGDLTDALEIEDGALLAYVVDRQPGDPASMEFIKSRLISTLDRYRAGILFEEWKDCILAQAGFEDFAPVVPEEEDNDQSAGD